MKRILLVALFISLCINSHAQTLQVIYGATRVGLYGGVGVATNHNYDLGTSAGIDFDKTIANRLHLGALLFMQGYNLYYDNEINSSKHEQGNEGLTLRHSSRYIFVAPQLKYHLWHKINFTSWVSFNAGIGFKMSGYDSVHKWHHNYDSLSISRYDSTLDASKNLNSMVMRFGVAFTQDIYLGHGNWWFTVKEDFGFLLSDLSKSVAYDNNNPSRTPYTPARMSPGYVSLQIGIAYIKPKTRK